MCEQPSKRQAKREKLLMHRNYSKSGELRPRRFVKSNFASGDGGVILRVVTV